MSSPSLMHEGVIALVRDKPAFAADLLRDLLHVDVPRFDEAQLMEAALHQLVPIEYHADAVVLFEVVDAGKKPVFGTIFEVQLLIERALSEAARKALAMEPHIQKFFTEAHRQSYDRGKSEGKAEGKAEDLVKILRRRGVVVTDEQQRQICACTDLATLDRWLDRAFSTASIDEILAEGL